MAKLNIEQEGGGLLFLNESDNPKAPMYNGAINVGGVQYDVALWEKSFDSGAEGFTVKVTERDGEDESPARGGRSSRSSSRGRSSSAPLKARPKPSRR